MSELLDLGLSTEALSALTEFFAEQKLADDAFSAIQAGYAEKKTKNKKRPNKKVATVTSGTSTPMSASASEESTTDESGAEETDETEDVEETAETDAETDAEPEPPTPQLTMASFKEDWQLSQFWYDDLTTKTMADELIARADGGLIACVSAPTVFLYLKNLDLPNPLLLLEIDTRFGIFSEFKVYDYNHPLDVEGLEAGGDLLGSAAAVLLDPPFLNDDCLSKTAETVRALSNDRTSIMVSSGWTVRNVIKRSLGAHIVEFRPRHKGGLANAFRCYINYESANPMFGHSTDPEDGDNDFLDQV